MMRRAMMYLRPGNLYKEFVIEDNKADIGKQEGLQLRFLAMEAGR